MFGDRVGDLEQANTVIGRVLVENPGHPRAVALRSQILEATSQNSSLNGVSLNLKGKKWETIEQVRFGDRLNVRWKIDPLVENAWVPSLLLQPLVENAVKHGVEPSPTGGAIRIRAQARHGHALVTITNTVPEGRPRKGHGMALHNVRDRLQLLHDLDMRFEAGPIEGGRFRVRLLVPLVKGTETARGSAQRQKDKEKQP